MILSLSFVYIKACFEYIKYFTGGKIMKKLLALILAVAMMLSMVACSNTSDDKGPKDAVTITFHYINGVGEQQYTDVVEAKLNEIMQAIEGYEHISIDLKPYSLDNYQSAITLAQANKEPLDIINTFELKFNTSTYISECQLIGRCYRNHWETPIGK